MRWFCRRRHMHRVHKQAHFELVREKVHLGSHHELESETFIAVVIEKATGKRQWCACWQSKRLRSYENQYWSEKEHYSVQFRFKKQRNRIWNKNSAHPMNPVWLYIGINLFTQKESCIEYSFFWSVSVTVMSFFHLMFFCTWFSDLFRSYWFWWLFINTQK